MSEVSKRASHLALFSVHLISFRSCNEFPSFLRILFFKVKSTVENLRIELKLICRAEFLSFCNGLYRYLEMTMRELCISTKVPGMSRPPNRYGGREIDVPVFFQQRFSA